MRYEATSKFVCGVKKLGLSQRDVKSYVFVTKSRQYVEYTGYVRKITDDKFILIEYNEGRTKFTVYTVTNDGNIQQLSTYTSQTNCFSDRTVYELTDKYILSGLNDVISVNKRDYTITHTFFPINNPYCEIIPVKYKYELNYNIMYLCFVKNSTGNYDVVVTDDFLHHKPSSEVLYNNPVLDGNVITESNITSITSYNEKNLYHYKSGNYIYIQVERPDSISRTTRFRDRFFTNLSRRYKYDIIQFDLSTGTFTTKYRSTENVIYYTHQNDFSPPTYLYKIERIPGSKYIVTVSTVEDSSIIIARREIPLEENFQLVAVTSVRDEIVIVEGRDVVRDNFRGMELLVTDITVENNNIVTNQSKLQVNLFCTKPGYENRTVGLDIKGITFYDSQLTFAVYCGSRRYDMNVVTVSIVSRNVFVADSSRKPFTYSFINHPSVRTVTEYVKAGLVKSRYSIPYEPSSVIFSVSGNLNNFTRVETNLTDVYFSKYRQSLKKVHDTVFVGDLSIGYDYRNNMYMIPLQEVTDNNVRDTDFKDYVQSYCLQYSPEIQKDIYILKKVSRYPTVIGLKDKFSRLVTLHKLPIISLQVGYTGFEILYIIGLSYEYSDTILSTNYYDSMKNLDLSKVRIFTTSITQLQKNYVRELDLSEFKSNNIPIFSSQEEFFGIYNIDSSNIAVVKQINPNAGIPILQDSGDCSYSYEFEIYYGLEHSQLQYYSTIEYQSTEPMKLYSYDPQTKTITYTQPVIFTVQSTTDSMMYDLYMYFIKNEISLDSRFWYTFEEIYGRF